MLLRAPTIEQQLEQTETEIDNLRAAFAWSREGADIDTAMRIAVSLSPLWLGRGKIREGLAWLDTAFAAERGMGVEAERATRSRAMAEKSMFDTVVLGIDRTELAEEALRLARDEGDPVVVARALSARARGTGRDAAAAEPFIAEAIALARETGQDWILSQVLGRKATLAIMSKGDAVLARAAAEEGLEIADRIGNGYESRQCRWCLGMADWFQGNLERALGRFAGLAEEATADHDHVWWVITLAGVSFMRAYLGDTTGARAAAEELVESGGEVIELYEGVGYSGLSLAAIADGDAQTAHRQGELAWRRAGMRT